MVERCGLVFIRASDLQCGKWCLILMVRQGWKSTIKNSKRACICECKNGYLVCIGEQSALAVSHWPGTALGQWDTAHQWDFGCLHLQWEVQSVFCKFLAWSARSLNCSPAYCICLDTGVLALPRTYDPWNSKRLWFVCVCVFIVCMCVWREGGVRNEDVMKIKEWLLSSYRWHFSGLYQSDQVTIIP